MEQQHAAAPPPAPAPKLPSAFALFGPSIEALKLNVMTFLGLIFTPLVLLVPLIIVMVIGEAVSDSGVLSVLFALAIFVCILGYLVVCILIGPALIAAQLKGAAGEHLDYGQAVRRGAKFWLRYLGLCLCTAVIVLLGFLLLIVPGVFMIKRYVLAPYFMIDQDLGIFEAMRQSAAAAKQFSGAVWGLLGVQLLVALVGIIPFVGFIVEILYLCAPAVRYHEIKQALGQRHHAPAHAAR